MQHRNNAAIPLSENVQIIQTAFKCRIVSYRVCAVNVYIDYQMFFNEIKSTVLDLLKNIIFAHNSIKVNMEVFGSYILPSTENYSSEKSFNTANQIIDGSSDLDEKYLWFVDKLMTQASEFLEKDSGML